MSRAQVSDAIRLKKLDVRLRQDSRSYIQLTRTRPTPNQRSVTKKVRWQRECKFLGGGTFGQVHLERCREPGRTDEKRATKRIEKIIEIDYTRELEALAVLSLKDEHRDSFVNFIGWYETGLHVYIVMDFHELGSLDRHLVPAGASISEQEAKTIMTQILEALKYMHELDFTHRDLKPANVLVATASPRWWVKIADFGFSKRAVDGHNEMQSIAGTPQYMAPELQKSCQGSTQPSKEVGLYTNAVDIWAAGIMTFQILSGRIPFRGDDLALYYKGQTSFPEDCMTAAGASNEACVFVRHLLAVQPYERPAARVCLGLVWLQGTFAQTMSPISTLHSMSTLDSHITELDEASATWSSPRQSSYRRKRMLSQSAGAAANRLGSIENSTFAATRHHPRKMSSSHESKNHPAASEHGPLASIQRVQPPEFKSTQHHGPGINRQAVKDPRTKTADKSSSPSTGSEDGMSQTRTRVNVVIQARPQRSVTSKTNLSLLQDLGIMTLPKPLRDRENFSSTRLPPLSLATESVGRKINQSSYAQHSVDGDGYGGPLATQAEEVNTSQVTLTRPISPSIQSSKQSSKVSSVVTDSVEEGDTTVQKVWRKIGSKTWHRARSKRAAEIKAKAAGVEASRRKQKRRIGKWVDKVVAEQGPDTTDMTLDLGVSDHESDSSVEARGLYRSEATREAARREWEGLYNTIERTKEKKRTKMEAEEAWKRERYESWKRTGPQFVMGNSVFPAYSINYRLFREWEARRPPDWKEQEQRYLERIKNQHKED